MVNAKGVTAYRQLSTAYCSLPIAGTVCSSVSVISDLQQASLFYNYKVRSMSLKTN